MQWARCGRSLALVFLLAGGLVSVASGPQAETEQQIEPEGAPLAGLENDRSGFFVEVGVDSPDCTYVEGEEMRVSVESSRAGYLYLFYRDAAGKTFCVFPNKYQPKHRIAAHQVVEVPAKGAPFYFRVVAPFGEELLRAVVTDRPLPPETVAHELLTAATATPLGESVQKSIEVALRKRPRLQWATDQIKVRTLPNKEQAAERKHRRVLLIVAVGRYAHSLQNCTLEAVAHDAQLFRRIMERAGQIDMIKSLVDEQATCEAIKEAICHWLVENTSPGDEVIIYWTGHGGKLSDENDQDERDGIDEYLKPYDADQSSMEAIQRTIITDDQMGRWLQRLDGRKVAVIIDACYGGGMAKGAKGSVPQTGPFDFLDTEAAEINRLLKDLDSLRVIVLSAAAENELAFQMDDAQASVFTYFLVEHLREHRPATVKQAYEHVRQKVPQFVWQTRGVKQTPLLGGEKLAEKFLLCP